MVQKFINSYTVPELANIPFSCSGQSSDGVLVGEAGGVAIEYQAQTGGNGLSYTVDWNKSTLEHGCNVPVLIHTTYNVRRKHLQCMHY